MKGEETAPNSSAGSQFTFHVFCLTAALLVAVVAAWPAVGEHGLLNTRGGGDSPFLLQRLHQLTAALGDGHFPARWMPDANYGYGYPFFNFYAPLSIYIAALFRFLGFSFVRAIHLSQLAAFVTAGWGAYTLGRRWFQSEWAGLLVSAAYTLAPFHLVNVYVRGDSLAEFWAMAFYPLVLLAVDKVAGGRWQVAGRSRYLPLAPCHLPLLALAYAGLIVSHNISALIFTPFVLLYVVFKAIGEQRRGEAAVANLLLRLLALGLGLALSAWFWWPALAERSLVQLGPVTAGYFHFSNHFRAADLVQTSFFFDFSDTDGRAFAMGLIQVVLAVIGAALFFWRSVVGRRRSAPLLFIGLTFIIATFMITPLSRPLWERLPLLPFVQFPWRFLSVQALAAAALVGGLALLPGRRVIVPAAIALLLVGTLGGLKTDHLALSDGDVTAERLAQYEWFTGNIGSTVSAEYLPHTVRPRPFTSAWLERGERDWVLVLSGAATAENVVRQSDYQEWQVGVTEGAATLALPTLFWPGWEALVDGAATPIRPSPGSGLITLDVPAGQHTVALRLGRTSVQRTAEAVSLLALVVTGGLIGWRLRNRRLWLRAMTAGRQRLRQIVTARAPLRVRMAVGVVIYFVVFFAVQFLIDRPELSGNLTWDFAQMGYLHHERALFEGGASLAGYTYSSETVEAGQELSITLDGLKLESGPATARLALVTPAVYRFEKAPLLAEAVLELSADAPTFRLIIPAEAPAGLYMPRLMLDGIQPVTPSGRARGALYLRPVRVLPSATEEAVAEGNPLQVSVNQVSQRDDGTLDLRLRWYAERPVSHNYNVSLRLTDAEGLELARFDTQPGYGFRPSTAWPAGEWLNDWLALPLPAELNGPQPYALVALLYKADTGAPVLLRRLGEVVHDGERLVYRPIQRNFTLPAHIEPLAVTFGDVARLRGYTLNQTAGEVQLALYWEALREGSEDYSRFVHLLDPVTENIVAQDDALPRRNTYPTSQWAAGEIISDPLTIDLTDVAAGEYRLAVGLYQKVGDSFPRLPVVDANGQALPSERVLISIEIKP